jgi:hypothetical protein
MTRATESGAPAANGTTIVTVRPGYVCAHAAVQTQMATQTVMKKARSLESTDPIRSRGHGAGEPAQVISGMATAANLACAVLNP